MNDTMSYFIEPFLFVSGFVTPLIIIAAIVHLWVMATEALQSWNWEKARGNLDRYENRKIAQLNEILKKQEADHDR